MISQQIEKERVIPSEKTSQNMPLLPHYSLNVSVSVCHSFSYSLFFRAANEGRVLDQKALNFCMMHLSFLSVLWL